MNKESRRIVEVGCPIGTELLAIADESIADGKVATTKVINTAIEAMDAEITSSIATAVDAISADILADASTAADVAIAAAIAPITPSTLVAALEIISMSDATDEATAIALANECKSKFNALLTALKA